MARTIAFNVSEAENKQIEALMDLLGFPKMCELMMEGIKILGNMVELAEEGYILPAMINPHDQNISVFKIDSMSSIQRRQDAMIIPFQSYHKV